MVAVQNLGGINGESEAKELPEEVMLGAVMFGHQQMQSAIKAIKHYLRKSAPLGTGSQSLLMKSLKIRLLHNPVTTLSKLTRWLTSWRVMRCLVNSELKLLKL